jgi:D-alanine-D-alanine ligase
LTVSIVGEQVFPIVDIRPSHELYDYECKYTEGMSTYECPAKLPSKLTKEIQQTAKKIFQILGCKNYGRIDFLLDTDGESWFLEVNTLPGMTKTSLVPKAFKAAGGSFEELIKRIIEETE